MTRSGRRYPENEVVGVAKWRMIRNLVKGLSITVFPRLERARSSELLAGIVFEGAFYSRARSIRGRGLFLSVSVTKFFSKHNNFKFKGFIIMFSFFVTVAEGAEGPSSGFEVIGRELAELDEGRSQEAMDNFFA